MATEKNPFEQKPEEVTNVIELNTPSEEISEQEISFEPSDDGGVIVDFSSESIEMAPEPEIEEWYGNLIDGLDEETLTEIAHDVRDKYQADKESRSEWESMFEKGFDLLGLKLQEGTEPFEGACTAVHPLLIESAVKFQAKASQELFPSGGPVKAQILGKQSVQKQAQANFDNQLKLKAFDLAYDEYTKSKVSEFEPADVKTFYSKTTPDETIDIDLNNKNSEIYTNPKFLESWTIEKPKDFKAANPKTFWGNDGKTQITVDLNDENSIFYTDPKFRENNTMEKPAGFKPANPKTFYKIGNKQESITIDLADPNSPFYTDPTFKETYTMEKPTPPKEMVERMGWQDELRRPMMLIIKAKKRT